MFGYLVKRIYLKDSKALEQVRQLLENQDLKLERTVTEMYGIYNGDQLIATGSIFDNVLKMIAVDPSYQGSEVINQLMSHLITQANNLGQTHLFIFTSPLKYKSFEYFGFTKVEATERVVLMENKPLGLTRYLKSLKDSNPNARGSAAVVVNCNPFTNGHRYLIEQAAKGNDKLHVFVLKENLSTFPNDIRYQLVKEGTKDLENVEIHWAQDYMISSATFPSYFLGDQADIVGIHTELDVKIFGQHIAKTLNITRRYIGKEPFNEVTNQYNQTLKKMLPNYGITVYEIERKPWNGKAISASTVRRLICEDAWEELQAIVPESTWAFLKSEEAKPIIHKLKKNYKPENRV